jgi:hypothetical protein
MFGTSKVKLDRDLLDRARRVADLAGYATVEEFISHLIERELQHFEDAKSDEDIKQKLKGLGYIS